MNNLELIDTLIKEKKTSIDVHKGILEIDNSRRWFHNKMIKECEEHIEILFKIKSELEEYQKLKEKETLKKVIHECMQHPTLNCDQLFDYYGCPNCNINLDHRSDYCEHCGQALDWSEYNE